MLLLPAGFGVGQHAQGHPWAGVVVNAGAHAVQPGSRQWPSGSCGHMAVTDISSQGMVRGHGDLFAGGRDAHLLEVILWHVAFGIPALIGQARTPGCSELVG